MEVSVKSAIELGRICPSATLPEQTSPGVYVLRSNSYRIVPPLSFVRATTGISIQFNKEGLIGRLSTIESSLITSKLIVCVENLKEGDIQVMMYNTSAMTEASITPGMQLAELTFTHSVSPLLYWREDLQKDGKGKEGKEKEKPKTKRWTSRRGGNRCDNVTNWRARQTTIPRSETPGGENVWDALADKVWDAIEPTSVTTSIVPTSVTSVTSVTSDKTAVVPASVPAAEVWDPIPSEHVAPVEDWDLEEAQNQVKYAPFKLDISNKKYGSWKNKPYMITHQNKVQERREDSSRTRRYIPLQKRNLINITPVSSVINITPTLPVPYSVTSSMTSTMTSNPTWTTCSAIFKWPPIKEEPVQVHAKPMYKDHLIHVDPISSPNID